MKAIIFASMCIFISLSHAAIAAGMYVGIGEDPDKARAEQQAVNAAKAQIPFNAQQALGLGDPANKVNTTCNQVTSGRSNDKVWSCTTYWAVNN